MSKNMMSARIRFGSWIAFAFLLGVVIGFVLGVGSIFLLAMINAAIALP
jgi:hypothetical protein